MGAVPLQRPAVTHCSFHSQDGAQMNAPVVSREQNLHHLEVCSGDTWAWLPRNTFTEGWKAEALPPPAVLEPAATLLLACAGVTYWPCKSPHHHHHPKLHFLSVLPLTTCHQQGLELTREPVEGNPELALPIWKCKRVFYSNFDYKYATLKMLYIITLPQNNF